MLVSHYAVYCIWPHETERASLENPSLTTSIEAVLDYALQMSSLRWRDECVSLIFVYHQQLELGRSPQWPRHFDPAHPDRRLPVQAELIGGAINSSQVARRVILGMLAGSEND